MLNVQDIQIKTKREEIIKQMRIKGVNANEYNITLELQEFFKNNTLGLPYFKPKRIFKGDVSDPKIYNDNFDMLYYDLSNSFNMFSIHSNESIISSVNISNRISNLTHKVNKLISDVTSLSRFAENKTSHNQTLLTFNDYSNINKKTDLDKNLYATTSEIDFNTSTVRNKIYTSAVNKINILGSDIKINNSSNSYNYTGRIDGLLNDISDDIYSVKAFSSSKTNSTELLVTLDNSIEASRIDLTSSFLYNSTVQLWLNKDGIFVFKNEIEGSGICSFKFNKESLNGFKIIITKSSPDIIAETNSFYYSFKNISIYNDKYERTSSYISSPILCDKTVSTVEIEPSHSIFNKTDISYYVGVEDNSGIISWKEIFHNKHFDLNTNKTYSALVNKYNDNSFGNKIENENGESYAITRLDENANKNSVQVHVGKSQWLIERLECPIPSNFKCNIKDYAKENVSHIAPYDANNVEIICSNENNYIVMSQYIYTEESVVVDGRFFDFKTTTEKFDCAIYVNGRQSFIKDKRYAFKLNKGENVIQVMFILANHKINGNIKPIRHNLNLLTYSSEIYAERKASQIEDLKLKNIISDKSLKYFSIVEEKGYDYISVMFNPVNSSNINITSCEYFRTHIQYKYIMQETLDSMITDDKLKIRIMAKLVTSDDSVSPYINNVKVICV